MRTFPSVQAFQAEGNRLHPGKDSMEWEFICPKCKKIHKVQDWIDAGYRRAEACKKCLDCAYETTGEMPILVHNPATGETNTTFEFARYSVAATRPKVGLGLF